MSHSVPEDDFTDSTSLSINEQSLGNDDGAAIALAPAQPFHGVQHWHYLGPNFFQSERWYHFHIAISHNRPGGQAIIIDGLVGRDISQDPSLSLQRGDHITLPAMPLATALPDGLITDASGGGSLIVPSVDLNQTAIHQDLGLNAASLFPARGTILIGNEYLSYTSITGNTLNGVYRSLRANTNTNGTDEEDRWPVIEEHAENSLVVPGSYRWSPASGGELYQGATESLHAIPNGDNDPASVLPWRLWTTPLNSATNHNNVAPTNGDHSHPFTASEQEHIWIVRAQITEDIPDGSGGTFPVTMDPNTSLPLDTIRSSPNDVFPADGGIIAVSLNTSIGSEDIFFHYGSFDGSQFLDLVPYDHPTLTTGTSPDSVLWNSEDGSDPAYVILISLRTLDGTESYHDIDNTDNFSNVSGLEVLQVEDPVTGRIEWISYDHAVQATVTVGGVSEDRHFFLSDDGWGPNARGKGEQLLQGPIKRSLAQHDSRIRSLSRLIPAYFLCKIG